MFLPRLLFYTFYTFIFFFFSISISSSFKVSLSINIAFSPGKIIPFLFLSFLPLQSSSSLRFLFFPTTKFSFWKSMVCYLMEARLSHFLLACFMSAMWFSSVSGLSCGMIFICIFRKKIRSEVLFFFFLAVIYIHHCYNIDVKIFNSDNCMFPLF